MDNNQPHTGIHQQLSLAFKGNIIHFSLEDDNNTCPICDYKVKARVISSLCKNSLSN
jgi:hypothetical protein